MRDLIAAYQKQRALHVSRNTLIHIERALTLFEEWFDLQGGAFEELTQNALVNFGGWLLERNLTHSSVRLYTTDAGKFLRWCRDEGVDLPTFTTPRYRTEIKNRPAIPADVLAGYMHARLYYPDPFATALGLLPLSGLRLGEMVSRELSDVHLAHGLLFLRVTGKSIRERNVPLPPDGTRLLAAYLSGNRLKLPDNQWLFPEPEQRRGHIEKRQLQQRINTIRKSLKVKGLTGHRLRHTYASIMHELGVRDIDLALLLGHEDPKTTQIYVHPNRARLASAIANMPTEWAKG